MEPKSETETPAQERPRRGDLGASGGGHDRQGARETRTETRRDRDAQRHGQRQRHAKTEIRAETETRRDTRTETETHVETDTQR